MKRASLPQVTGVNRHRAARPKAGDVGTAHECVKQWVARQQQVVVELSLGYDPRQAVHVAKHRHAQTVRCSQNRVHRYDIGKGPASNVLYLPEDQPPEEEQQKIVQHHEHDLGNEAPLVLHGRGQVELEVLPHEASFPRGSAHRFTHR